MSKGDRNARDLQTVTGAKYTTCLRIVRKLTPDQKRELMRRVDAAPDHDGVSPPLCPGCLQAGAHADGCYL